MSSVFPITTEGGVDITTEYGATLLIESSAYGLSGNYSSAAPYQELITSEHNQKPNFMALIGVLCAGIGDTTALIESIPQAFSLPLAEGAQLDVLGLWIGQPRVIPSVLTIGYFGFSDLRNGLAEGLQLTYGELQDVSKGGIFLGLQDNATSTTTLNDAQYRTVLQARIVRNQSNGTLPALEAGLLDIFGVNCKVTDNGTLSLAINVPAPVSPVDQALVSGLDILPRPAGVAIGSVTYMP